MREATLGHFHRWTPTKDTSGDVTNIDDAIARATTIENIANAPRMSEVNYVKINNSVFNKKSHVKVPFQGKCNKCQKVGHKEVGCYSN